MVLLPNDWMLCLNERWKPLMRATIPITVPTPITIPSSASKERSRFAISARAAMPRASRSRNRFTGSLVAQGFDRVEPGRAPGRVGAEEHPDPDGHADAEEDRGAADGGGQRAPRPGEQREPDAPHDADQPAAQRERGGLDQELGEDVAPPGAHRLAHADLPRAPG